MTGTIEKISSYPEKGSAGIEMAKALLTRDLGLEGDFHSTGGDKQLSLLLAETLDQINGQKDKGLCLSRFRENIRIRGMTPDVIRPGTRLEAGEAELEITGEIKRCYEECSLYQEGKRCPLAGTSLFARVLKSGFIRPGDRVVTKDITK